MTPAWPVSYDDLEPYYVQAEHLYWAHGQHGEDPFAGRSSRDYPFPPVGQFPRIQELSDGLEKLGLHPFHLPIGVHLTQDAEGNATPGSRCIPAATGSTVSRAWSVRRPTRSGPSSGPRWPRTVTWRRAALPDRQRRS